MSDRLEVKTALAGSDMVEITGTAWPFGPPAASAIRSGTGAFSGPATLAILFSDDHTQVIGVRSDVTETTAGLDVSGKLLVDDVERAREVGQESRIPG